MRWLLEMLRTENKFILKNKNIDTFFNQNSLYKIYAQRKIFSVYFDTDNFKDFYTSEEGTVPRKKIRFRTYNSLIINRALSRHRKPMTIVGRVAERSKASV